MTKGMYNLGVKNIYNYYQTCFKSSNTTKTDEYTKDCTAAFLENSLMAICKFEIISYDFKKYILYISNKRISYLRINYSNTLLI